MLACRATEFLSTLKQAQLLYCHQTHRVIKVGDRSVLTGVQQESFVGDVHFYVLVKWGIYGKIH